MPTDRDTLAPLVDELLELAGRPGEQDKMRMWADHQALARGGPGKAKIPITVYYEGMPDQFWQGLFGAGYQTCADPLARSIERDLRRRIWIARNVPDDHIVWPAVHVPARVTRPADWGVPLERHKTADVLGAYKPIAPLAERLDVGRVRFTDQQIDDAATRLAVEQARELTRGRLAVHVNYPDLQHSPFEVLVQMRGIEQLMMDAIERPDEIRAMMDVITAAYVEHHRTRERRGQINRHESADGRYLACGFRVHCYHASAVCSDAVRRFLPSEAKNALTGTLQTQPADSTPHSEFRIPHLHDEWAYISAQSASGYGSRQFAELVHPFNCRLAELFPNKTVYYHGCECLDQKLDVLAALPNLRRFHVSPWSSVAAAVAKFRGRVVLEVHAHPGKVFFGGTADSMRAELRGLIDPPEGTPIDLNLSDIHSVNGRPATLGDWARIAQDLA
jgi:hypothetical protein